MAAALALAVLLPGTATPGPAPPSPPPIPEWVDAYAGGELGFTAPTGEAYRVHLDRSSVLPDDPDDEEDETTVVLRGRNGDAAAAMVVTEDEVRVRVVANTPEGSYRYGGQVHPDRGLSEVTWQGRPL